MKPSDALAAFQHKDWASHPVERLADGIERQMISAERLMICRLSIAPGVVTPVHAHPHEQMTIVERGRVRFTVAGVDRIASAGEVLVFPSGIEHGATMLEEPVVLVDIFSPPREDFLAGTAAR
ncbi:MAG TPA: cupin domain-containing protein [Vicinamibacterales bacterium]|jgi:quercetin dioxygenase-like cupin family protein